MTLTILFSGRSSDWTKYGASLRAGFREAGIAAHLSPEPGPPEAVDYIIYAPNPALQDFTPYTRLRAVLSLWAGVETIVGNPTLSVPLVRMVEPGLQEGMVEWVVGHTLRHHLGIDAILRAQDGTWAPRVPPLARNRPVTVLGLGALGAASAAALAALNFPVTGWSRAPRTVPGVTCLAGPDAFEAALATAQILVLLLPLTPETDSLLDAARLALLPEGAVILNPGRGALIDDAALLDALDSGRLGHATLDVFRTEPLPAGHRFWSHPGITVTPHIASETRADTAAAAIARNIRRDLDGEPLQNVVDMGLGY